jgi:molybdenum cofactor guanylyltransferase
MSHTDRQRSLGLISAAILAGGQSRRMGTDKALLSLSPGGPAVLQTVLEAARTVSGDVFVVAPTRPAYLELGCPLVPERSPGVGPLGGVEAALRAARHDRCLVLACDLPLLAPALLGWLAACQTDRAAVVPLSREPGAAGATRPQPLVAVYHPSCLPHVTALLDSGERRMSALLDRIEVRYVEPEELEMVDPGLRSFLNLNTPEDLARVRRLLAAPADAAGPEQANDRANRVQFPSSRGQSRG